MGVSASMDGGGDSGRLRTIDRQIINIKRREE